MNKELQHFHGILRKQRRKVKVSKLAALHLLIQLHIIKPKYKKPMSLPENHITKQDGKEVFWCIGEKIAEGIKEAWGHLTGIKKEIAYFAKYNVETNQLTCIIKIR